MGFIEGGAHGRNVASEALARWLRDSTATDLHPRAPLRGVPLLSGWRTRRRDDEAAVVTLTLFLLGDSVATRIGIRVGELLTFDQLLQYELLL